MKNKKGFTLIELLAVIVILAVIALIATPLIMNVINDAKKGANKASAYEYIKAVETAIVTDTIKNGGNVDINKYLTQVQPNLVKGTIPDSINLTVDANGKITGGSITIGGVTFVPNSNGELSEGPVTPSKTWKEKTGQLYTMTANTTGMFTVTGDGETNAWKVFDNNTATSVDVMRDNSYNATIMFGKAIKIKEMAFAAGMYNGAGGFRAEGGGSEYTNIITVNGIKTDGTKVSAIVRGYSESTTLFTAASTSEEEFIGIEIYIQGTSYISSVSEIQITKWLELE